MEKNISKILFLVSLLKYYRDYNSDRSTYKESVQEHWYLMFQSSDQRIVALAFDAKGSIVFAEKVFRN